ncbi:Uma2 family endonuclease [Rhodohalobacter sp. SW132]|uniref:Uma2 family endonuclease n=1 Tax=Rhodohalobacter sp. SW132 TaxID=2293433 RepID=UPI000E25DD20|nr:Uma2 family endonuclease [Rhodohalobacter sp. SW132]REL38404.1 Uma2 family endonuclease [Rhodohalobacter sp. SW132]
MPISTLSQLTTYDDYRGLPDDGNQHQIIGGELYMTPAPTTQHQRILLNIFRLLDPFVNENEIGEILIAPVDVVLSMTDVVQPDLIFIARERLNIITKKNIVDAPDLVVEVLSDNTENIDRQKKSVLYEKYGVKEYWIVDSQAKTIEQLVLKKNSFQLLATVSGTQKLSSVVLEKLTLTADDVFG